MDSTNHPRDRHKLLGRAGFVGSVAVGAALLGSAFGGMVGVDRKLEAATPDRSDMRFVRDAQPGAGRDCPREKRSSREL